MPAKPLLRESSLGSSELAAANLEHAALAPSITEDLHAWCRTLAKPIAALQQAWPARRAFHEALQRQFAGQDAALSECLDGLAERARRGQRELSTLAMQVSALERTARSEPDVKALRRAYELRDRLIYWCVVTRLLDAELDGCLGSEPRGRRRACS